MRRDIRLIVSDIDNTLLRSDGSMAPETTAALERAARAGIDTVLASSRTPLSAGFLLDRVGNLTHMIMLTGCAVRDMKSGEYLYRRSIAPEHAAAILRRADATPDCYFEACDGERYVLGETSLEHIKSRSRFARYLRDLEPCLDVVPSLAEHFRGRAVDKMFVYADEDGRLREIIESLPGRDRLNFVSPIPHGCDILPRGADKGEALRALLAALSLREEQVAVFGDSENDEAMFLPGALKVAVGNAYPSLKAKADFVAPTNDENGVAQAIDALLLGS